MSEEYPGYVVVQPGEEIEPWWPWIDCWSCFGEGEHADCFEEFACIDPESGCDSCLTRCDICKGAGGWFMKPAEDVPQQAAKGDG